MLTIDASVYINALNPREEGSSDSLSLLRFIQQRSLSIYSPTLLLVEVASSLSRVFAGSERALELIDEFRSLPVQTWVALDYPLAIEAAQIGSSLRLKGADAVYAAVALRYKSTLVTLDQQQLVRLEPVLPVRRPGEILSKNEP